MKRSHKYSENNKVRKSYADGGPVHSYGAPMGTPKPGQTTKKRPKVGDRDPNYDPSKKKRRSSSSPAPAKKKSSSSDTTYRDYRGVDGVVEDAVKGKKK